MTDSLHSGDKSQVVKLVRIETDVFDFFIQGRPVHPTVGELGYYSTFTSLTTAIIEKEISFEFCNILFFRDDHMEGDPSVPSSPLFFENQDYQIIIRKKSERSVSFYHEHPLIRDAIKKLSSDLWVGTVNFRNEVGMTELIIRVDGIDALSLSLEVFPSKVDYQNDYQDILKEVEQAVYNLAYSFLSRTFQFASAKSTSSPSLTEFFTLFRSVYDQLSKALERIETFPIHNLQREERIVPSARLKNWGKENTKYIRSRPYLLEESEHVLIQVNGRSLFPVKGILVHKEQNFDTHENRFIRWMLERIVSKIKAVKKSYLLIERVKDPEIIHFLDEAEMKMERHIRKGFLSQVGKIHTFTPTIALQLAPGYRDVFRLYLLVMKGLHVSSELFKLSLKNLALLYEYWCFLQIHEILKKKFTLINEDVVKVRQEGLFVSLDKTRASKFVYRDVATGQKVALFYNTLPDWHSAKMPTVSQRPDSVLTLQKEGSTSRISYIFDAKYKINPAISGTEYHIKYGQPGPEEDDINTMHRYRDAIVHSDEGGEYKRTIYGAFVLFPYHNEDRYTSHRFYLSIEKVNIGGLPFLPGSTKLVEELIDRLLDEE